MTTADLQLQPAEEDGLGYVETMLARNDLPVDDVHDKPECFYVATADGERVGVGGVEVHGTDGLLRSLVVADPVRGEGYGATLHAALEREAQSDGVEALYLLTTTAADFFDRQGYVEIERADAPEAIRATTEFSELCPDSATCMRKRL